MIVHIIHSEMLILLPRERPEFPITSYNILPLTNKKKKLVGKLTNILY